ncbi:MAG: hypothetical protein RLZZ427_1347, partial [Pseudomonadota bacterium]
MAKPIGSLDIFSPEAYLDEQ